MQTLYDMVDLTSGFHGAPCVPVYYAGSAVILVQVEEALPDRLHSTSALPRFRIPLSSRSDWYCVSREETRCCDEEFRFRSPTPR